jgi:hypothetical protein
VDYNRTIDGGAESNAFVESLTLFESVVNNESFRRIPLFLVLNKKDLLQDHCKLFPLKSVFEDYQGSEDSVDDAIDYLKNKFVGLNTRHERTFHLYISEVTNANYAKSLLKAIVSAVMEHWQRMRATQGNRKTIK